MFNSDAELDDFKQNIDLRAYAESLGYEWDRKDSWKNAFIMRRGGDKIKISRNSNGHWIYSSYRDDADNGTIVDFALHRRGLSLGRLRQELRPWAGGSLWTPQGQEPVPPVPAKGIAKDRAAVQQALLAMPLAPEHAYLRGVRRIPAAVLGSPRFAERVRLGAHGAAVFPHYDAEGICGYEIKNTNFTGFSPGGTKGLWISQGTQDDDCLIVCESAIEALSYAALFGDERLCYVSTAGYVGARQRELLQRAIAGMADGADIVAAMNGDPSGQTLAGIVKWCFEQACRADLHFFNQVPKGYNDWNEQWKGTI